jgi:Ca2+-binding EF-hand superfamily protein
MVKIMLHPKNAPKLRVTHEHIDANLTGYISWARLVESLRKSGEFLNEDDIEAFVLDDGGIQFHVRSR